MADGGDVNMDPSEEQDQQDKKKTVPRVVSRAIRECPKSSHSPRVSRRFHRSGLTPRTNDMYLASSRRKAAVHQGLTKSRKEKTRLSFREEKKMPSRKPEEKTTAESQVADQLNIRQSFNRRWCTSGQHNEHKPQSRRFSSADDLNTRSAEGRSLSASEDARSAQNKFRQRPLPASNTRSGQLSSKRRPLSLSELSQIGSLPQPKILSPRTEDKVRLSFHKPASPRVTSDDINEIIHSDEENKTQNLQFVHGVSPFVPSHESSDNLISFCETSVASCHSLEFNKDNSLHTNMLSENEKVAPSSAKQAWLSDLEHEKPERMHSKNIELRAALSNAGKIGTFSKSSNSASAKTGNAFKSSWRLQAAKARESVASLLSFAKSSEKSLSVKNNGVEATKGIFQYQSSPTIARRTDEENMQLNCDYVEESLTDRNTIKFTRLHLQHQSAPDLFSSVTKVCHHLKTDDSSNNRRDEIFCLIGDVSENGDARIDDSVNYSVESLEKISCQNVSTNLQTITREIGDSQEEIVLEVSTKSSSCLDENMYSSDQRLACSTDSNVQVNSVNCFLETIEPISCQGTFLNKSSHEILNFYDNQGQLELKNTTETHEDVQMSACAPDATVSVNNDAMIIQSKADDSEMNIRLVGDTESSVESTEGQPLTSLDENDYAELCDNFQGHTLSDDNGEKGLSDSCQPDTLDATESNRSRSCDNGKATRHFDSSYTSDDLRLDLCGINETCISSIISNYENDNRPESFDNNRSHTTDSSSSETCDTNKDVSCSENSLDSDGSRRDSYDSGKTCRLSDSSDSSSGDVDKNNIVTLTPSLQRTLSAVRKHLDSKLLETKSSPVIDNYTDSNEYSSNENLSESDEHLSASNITEGKTDSNTHSCDENISDKSRSHPVTTDNSEENFNVPCFPSEGKTDSNTHSCDENISDKSKSQPVTTDNSEENFNVPCFPLKPRLHRIKSNKNKRATQRRLQSKPCSNESEEQNINLPQHFPNTIQKPHEADASLSCPVLTIESDFPNQADAQTGNENEALEREVFVVHENRIDSKLCENEVGNEQTFGDKENVFPGRERSDSICSVTSQISCVSEARGKREKSRRVKNLLNNELFLKHLTKHSDSLEKRIFTMNSKGMRKSLSNIDLSTSETSYLSTVFGECLDPESGSLDENHVGKHSQQSGSSLQRSVSMLHKIDDSSFSMDMHPLSRRSCENSESDSVVSQEAEDSCTKRLEVVKSIEYSRRRRMRIPSFDEFKNRKSLSDSVGNKEEGGYHSSIYVIQEDVAIDERSKNSKDNENANTVLSSYNVPVEDSIEDKEISEPDINVTSIDPVRQTASEDSVDATLQDDSTISNHSPDIFHSLGFTFQMDGNNLLTNPDERPLDETQFYVQDSYNEEIKDKSSQKMTSDEVFPKHSIDVMDGSIGVDMTAQRQSPSSSNSDSDQSSKTAVLRSTSDASDMVSEERERRRRDRKDRPYKSDPFSGTNKLPEHALPTESTLSKFPSVSTSCGFPSLEELAECSDSGSLLGEEDEESRKRRHRLSNISTTSEDSGVSGHVLWEATNEREDLTPQSRQQKSSGCARCKLYSSDYRPDQATPTMLSMVSLPPPEALCKRCTLKIQERKEIIQEIADTEKRYGRDLKILKEEFYRPMKATSLLTIDQLDTIFLNLDEMLHVQKQFMTRLTTSLVAVVKAGDETLSTMEIGSVFLESTRLFLAFENYCINQARSSILLEQLEKEKELLRVFLEVAQNENSKLRRMHLKSFIMVPVQRIMKYPLLLNRLYKVTPNNHPDKENLKQAQENIEDILDHINAKTHVPSRAKRRSLDLLGYSLSDKIEVNRVALEVLGWSKKDVCDLVTSRLWYGLVMDPGWAAKRARHIKFSLIHAVLLTHGRPLNSPIVGEMASPRESNSPVQVAMVLVKEKAGRFQAFREPLLLERCVITVEQEFDQVFELHEQGKETYLFKAEHSKETQTWIHYLKQLSRNLGYWRRRRNAMSNIMLRTV